MFLVEFYNFKKTVFLTVNTLVKNHLKHVLYLHRKFIRDKHGLRGEFERYLLCYTVIYVAMFCCTAFAIKHVYQNEKTNLFVDAITAGFLVITYFLLVGGKTWQGKFLGTVVSNLFIVFNASFVGRAGGYQYIFFPIICGVLLVFSFQERRITILCLIFTFCSIGFLETTDYALFMKQPISKESIKMNSLVSLFFSIGLVYVYVSHIIRSNGTSFLKLERLYTYLIGQKRRLERVNMELDIFVYKASHDLKAPLSSMLGLITLMKAENDVSKMREYLGHHEKSINKLNAYIQSILNISRNERIEITASEINFKSLFNDTCAQLNYISTYSSIQKRIEVIQEVPFFSDPIRLSIIFNNLISNSIRYADLRKDRSYINVLVKINTAEAIISIYDNGQGIRPEYQDKVYNMFFRANESGNGSGLGLYIVKETLTKLNGVIEINSTFGVFTEFKFSIPNQYAKKYNPLAD